MSTLFLSQDLISLYQRKDLPYKQIAEQRQTARNGVVGQSGYRTPLIGRHSRDRNLRIKRISIPKFGIEN